MDYRIGAINRLTTGWMAYSRLAEVANPSRDLDGWLRHSLRQIHWKHWKTATARRHNLRIRGIPERNARKWAGSSKGHWRVAGSPVLHMTLPTTYWDRTGLKTLSQTWQRLSHTV
jgi:RNA-directed DNA polymerase